MHTNRVALKNTSTQIEQIHRLCACANSTQQVQYGFGTFRSRVRLWPRFFFNKTRGANNKVGQLARRTVYLLPTNTSASQLNCYMVVFSRCIKRYKTLRFAFKVNSNIYFQVWWQIPNSKPKNSQRKQASRTKNPKTKHLGFSTSQVTRLLPANQLVN